MNQISYRANLLLTAETALLCLAGLLLRLLSPAAILPRPGVPTLVVLSLLALLLSGKPKQKESLLLSVLLAGGTFTLLPWCAGLPTALPLWGMFLLGGAVFFLTAGLYRTFPQPSEGHRLPALVSALGLWLASQGFLGFW